MSKKLFRTLCALALGVGAGMGIAALLEYKRKHSISSTADTCDEPIPADPIDAVCEEQEVAAPPSAEESEEEYGARVIRETMAEFGVGGHCEVTYVSSPCHIRYIVPVSPVSAVYDALERVEDVALRLCTHVRSELVKGKPGILAMEVVKKMPCAPRYSEINDASENPLEAPIGIDVEGNTVYCNLVKMPHLLMAGRVGSGRSVTTNVILTGLLEKNYPENLRLLAVDLRRIEYAMFENTPHLYAPPIASEREAVAAFRALVKKMESRFSLMKNASVRTMNEYNQKVGDVLGRHLPYIVVAVDDLADLMTSAYREELEKALTLLLQKGRPAGIHLILGTQRTDGDVITGRLKCNIPSRIAFSLQDERSSRDVLDMNGAELLAARGDMLYAPVTENSPLRAQGIFLPEEEAKQRLEALRKALPPLTYDEDFCALLGEELAALRDNETENETEDTEQDPLFTDALKLFVENDKVATSLLQRRLAIGYSRAAKIVDRMEARGLITSYAGNKPRRLLPAAKEYLEALEGAESSEPELF